MGREPSDAEEDARALRRDYGDRALEIANERIAAAFAELRFVDACHFWAVWQLLQD